VGRLIGAHYRDLALRPAEQCARIEGAAAHAVIAGAERAVRHHGEFRHFRARLHHDHLGAVLGDAALFVFLADHVTGDVLQKYEWRMVLIAQLHKVRGLQRAVVEQHAVVAEHADLVAPDIREAADHRLAVIRLVFGKTAAIDDTRDHFAHIELLLDVVGDDAVQLVWVVIRIFRGFSLRREFGFLFPLHGNLAADGDGLALIAREIIAGATDAGVHTRTAEFIDSYVFAGRGFNQRWAAEKYCA